MAHVERDAFAAAVLVARMADQALDRAPVWDDLATFDGRPWRGAVDLVTAGFPCQPWSAAGRRQGTGDDRWLWPEVARVVAEVGPGAVLLENVPGLASGGGLGAVLGDLAAFGFDAEWDRFTAADVGAPHLRRRLFVLAWRPVAHSDRGGQPQLGRQPAHDTNPRDHADGPGPPLADTDRRGRGPGQRPDGSAAGPGAGAESGSGGDVGDPTGPGPQGLLHGAHPGRQGPGRAGDLWPPRPDDHKAWADAIRAGLPQPAVRRVADGLAHRLDRLHTIGNGVVPLVAAIALHRLADRAGLDLHHWTDMTTGALVEDTTPDRRPA